MPRRAAMSAVAPPFASPTITAAGLSSPARSSNSDSVYVVFLQYGDDSYTSVHTSQDGAAERLRETAAQWGIADILDADQLTHQITKLPVETP